MPRHTHPEDRIYAFICNNPGRSLYGLSKALKWTSGRVRFFVENLERDGLITSKREVENGRAKRLVYPVDWKELLPIEDKRDLENI